MRKIRLDKKIKIRLAELWRRLDYKLKRFEDNYQLMKERIKERKTFNACIDAMFAASDFRVIVSTLDAIFELENLFKQEVPGVFEREKELMEENVGDKKVQEVRK